jgi:hypothetical protein
MFQKLVNKFLRNEHKEQEIFLACYVFSCTCTCWLVFGLYSVLFALGIFCFSFVLYALFSFLTKRFQGSDLLFFITIFGFLFLVTISLVYEKYLLTVIIFIVITASWFKKTYIPKITKDINLEKYSNVERFFIDFEVINYHFETEFRLIGLFKDINMVATVIFFRLALLMFSQANGTSSIEFEIDRTAMVSLFYWLSLNALIIFLTRSVIVQYCNPPMGWSNFQKLFGYVGPLGLGTLNFLGFHVVTTSGFVDPLPFWLSQTYQDHTLGYKFYSRYEAILAQAFIFTNKGALPPLNPDHSLNMPALQESLTKMSEDQIRRVIAATPYILRPDVEILLHGSQNQGDGSSKNAVLDIRK